MWWFAGYHLYRPKTVTSNLLTTSDSRTENGPALDVGRCIKCTSCLTAWRSRSSQQPETETWQTHALGPGETSKVLPLHATKCVYCTVWDGRDGKQTSGMLVTCTSVLQQNEHWYCFLCQSDPVMICTDSASILRMVQTLRQKKSANNLYKYGVVVTWIFRANNAMFILNYHEIHRK